MREVIEIYREDAWMDSRGAFPAITEDDPLCNCIQMLLAKDHEENGASPL